MSNSNERIKKLFFILFLYLILVAFIGNRNQTPELQKEAQIVLDDSSSKLDTEASLATAFNDYRILMVTFHGIYLKTVDKAEAVKIVRL